MCGHYRWRVWAVVSVCHHLVVGIVEQASAEENLFLLALTPLQRSHSFPPCLSWDKMTRRGLNSSNGVSLRVLVDCWRFFERESCSILSVFLNVEYFHERWQNYSHSVLVQISEKKNRRNFHCHWQVCLSINFFKNCDRCCLMLLHCKCQTWEQFTGAQPLINDNEAPFFDEISPVEKRLNFVQPIFILLRIIK